MKIICPICNCKDLKKFIRYTKPPKVEKDYGIKGKYEREYLKCNNCYHLVSNQNLINFKRYYQRQYSKVHYKNIDNLKKTFKKIIKYPTSKSDNKNRVNRVKNFYNIFKTNKKVDLLDVGSGLGVFPYEIKKIGWNCYANEPGIEAANFIKKKLNIKVFKCNFEKISTNKKFDIITLNKILEHVNNPVNFLKIAKRLLKPNGIIYFEVPDGESALKVSKNCQEFTIEHLTVFAFQSIMSLINKTNLIPLKIERIKEVSGKYTLIAFVKN